MDSKIQELTEKLFHEGVEKGNEEAQAIVGNAKNEAAKILSEANEKAAGIVADAQKKAEELEANVKSELKLYADQSVNALKSEITNLITDQVTKEAVKAVAGNKTFLNDFMLNIASKWSQNSDIVISAKDADDLKAYFAQKAKELLDSGKVKIENANNTGVAFSISPKDGSYRVDFGAEEIGNYFKAFLRPQLIKMLF